LKIFYVKHADIDKEKWDQCIDNSANGLIYAYSYYLDIMSENWDALVMNDYEAIMPLTCNKKFGISYLRQPPFTQQLGIFGNFSIKNDLTEKFITEASKYFPFMEINFNYSNEYKKATATKCNLILPLNRPFFEIAESFRKDFVKRVKRNNLIYNSSQHVEKAIQLFKENYSDRIHTSRKNYGEWLHLCILLKSKKQLFVREVTAASGELLSIALFLKDSRRIYYVMSITLASGRKNESNYFLLYNVIKEFAEQNLILDFEGSDIPSIKLFFKKFGAVEQPYSFVRINHLSFFKKQIKSISDFYKFNSKKNRLLL